MAPHAELQLAAPPEPAGERRKRRAGMLLGAGPALLAIAISPLCTGSALTAALWAAFAFLALVIGTGRLIYIGRAARASAASRRAAAAAGQDVSALPVRAAAALRERLAS